MSQERKRMCKFVFPFISFAILLIPIILVIDYPDDWAGWNYLIGAMFVSLGIGIIILLIMLPGVKKAEVEQQNQMINIKSTDDEVLNEFRLYHLDKTIRFNVNGLYIIESDQLINYEQIKFTVFRYIYKNYTEYFLHIHFLTEDEDQDQILLTEDVLYFIRKYEFQVNHIEILNDKQKEITEKITFKAKNKLFKKLIIMLFLLVAIGILVGVMFNNQYNFIIYMAIGAVSTHLFMYRPKLTITNAGFKYNELVTILHEDVERIIVLNQEIIITNGFYDIKYPYSLKIIEVIKKYVDESKIEIV